MDEQKRRSEQRNNYLRQHRIQRNWRQQDVAERLNISAVTVQRWEQGSQQPSTYYRVKLSELFQASAYELGLIETTSPSSLSEREVLDAEQGDGTSTEKFSLWMVPYARNIHFTGREEFLHYLEQQFSSPAINRRSVISTQMQAIKGLGGIGKTQIALEYAYRAREHNRYTHILWINAASTETVLASFTPLINILPALHSHDKADQHKLVVAIIDWLEQCQQPWLLIFDNVNDLSLLRSYLPRHGNGNILLTTRAHAVGAFASSIKVEDMSVNEGTQLLLKRAGCEASTDEINEANNLAEALAQFPLALDQAGAYIEETGCSLQDYLRLYQEHRSTLLARRGRQATNYPESVATTWSLSLQNIEQTNPAAAELLHLCAFLAPDHIPEELLTEGASYWPPLLRQAMATPLAFNQLLETLLAFSLVERQIAERTLSIHRLVQIIVRDRMVSEERLHWTERIIRAVHHLFPHHSHEMETWPLCIRYLEQVEACEKFIGQYDVLSPEIANLLERAAIYLRERASYHTAEQWLRQTLNLRKRLLEQQAVHLASSQRNMVVYEQQGTHFLPEPLFRKALALKKHDEERQHADTAQSMRHLALLFRQQGNEEQAELLLQRAHVIVKQSLPMETAEIAITLQNLADVYRKQGNYTEAESLYQRAFTILESQVGSQHPGMIAVLNGLAGVYFERGNYTEAESLYQRAFTILESQVGSQHPKVASTLNKLASLHFEQGKYTKAEHLYQQAFTILNSQAEPHHADMASTLNGLANLYFVQMEYTKAESLYQQALSICEQQLGPSHPYVAYILNCLASLYFAQREYAKAEPLYQQALSIREQQLGPNHPYVAYALSGLANLYFEQSEYAKAEPFYRRALAIRGQTLPPTHPDLVNTLHDFALLQYVQGKTDDVAKLDATVLLHQRDDDSILDQAILDE